MTFPDGVSAQRPTREGWALTSIPKAVLDLLQDSLVLRDDSQVTSLTARWDNTVAPGGAIIVIKPVMADAEV